MSLLKQLRQDAGLRQIDMAKALGKPQAFVRRLDLLELRQVCGVLGLSLIKFVQKFERMLD